MEFWSNGVMNLRGHHSITPKLQHPAARASQAMDDDPEHARACVTFVQRLSLQSSRRADRRSRFFVASEL